jgi:hypothetical protein
MSHYRGRDGVVKFGTPLAALAWVQNWNLDETTDTVSGWGMGDVYESTFTTVRRWTGSVEVYLDDADAGQVVAVGDELELELYPGGEVDGSGYFSGTAFITGLNRSGDKAGIPGLTINLLGNGALTPATVAA